MRLPCRWRWAKWQAFTAFQKMRGGACSFRGPSMDLDAFCGESINPDRVPPPNDVPGTGVAAVDAHRARLAGADTSPALDATAQLTFFTTSEKSPASETPRQRFVFVGLFAAFLQLHLRAPAPRPSRHPSATAATSCPRGYPGGRWPPPLGSPKTPRSSQASGTNFGATGRNNLRFARPAEPHPRPVGASFSNPPD